MGETPSARRIRVSGRGWWEIWADAGVSFSGVSFSGVSFSGVPFSGVSFSGVSFSLADCGDRC